MNVEESLDALAKLEVLEPSAEEKAARIAKLHAETALLELQRLKAQHELTISGHMATGAAIAAEREIARMLGDGATDSKARVFRYNGEIGHNGAATVMRYLDEWMRLDAASENPADHIQPYTVQFTTPGGDIVAGLAIFDYLTNVDRLHPITTVAVGLCASMGAVVMQAGSKRLSFPSTSWLIHRASWGAIGREDEIEDTAAHAKLLQDRIFEILSLRSQQTVKTLKAKSARRDWWFLGTEAAELGIVDGLV